MLLLLFKLGLIDPAFIQGPALILLNNMFLSFSTTHFLVINT